MILVFYLQCVYCYISDVGTKGLVHKFMALPVLPVENIRPAFDLIAAGSPAVFAPFVQYIQEQWISGNIFIVSDLSVFMMESRTNNDVDGYHHRINAKAF